MCGLMRRTVLICPMDMRCERENPQADENGEHRGATPGSSPNCKQGNVSVHAHGRSLARRISIVNTMTRAFRSYATERVFARGLPAFVGLLKKGPTGAWPRAPRELDQFFGCEAGA
jgi:hypothetical protein